MNRTGLLVISNLSRLANTFKVSREYVFGTLYVQLYVPKTAPVLTIPRFSEIVQSIYKTSLSHCYDLDVRVLVASDGHPVRDTILDILMLDSWMPADVVKDIRDKFESTNFVNLGEQDITKQKSWRSFDKADIAEAASNNVILGGTFDRLHVGHKLMLTEAAMLAKKRLVVGVTDVNMIQSKTLFELLLPTEKRIEGVNEFLTSIDNTLQYEVVPITNPFGPTETDPNLDLIVVSQETFKGGEKCNELRDRNKFNPLIIHCIDVVEREQDSDFKESKISSSNQRIDLLGTRFREPVPNTRLAKKPYIIGLICGACVELDQVSDLLKSKGAVVIDCDKIAYELCPEKDWLQESSRGEWPTVRERVRQEVANKCSGKKVCVLQGDIVMAAGWLDDCHEIWSVIIPIKKALDCLMDVKGKTKEEALQTLAGRPDNHACVARANVVFSTNWGEEFTKVQIERAWQFLEKQIGEFTGGKGVYPKC